MAAMAGGPHLGSGAGGTKVSFPDPSSKSRTMTTGTSSLCPENVVLPTMHNMLNSSMVAIDSHIAGTQSQPSKSMVNMAKHLSHHSGNPLPNSAVQTPERGSPVRATGGSFSFDLLRGQTGGTKSIPNPSRKLSQEHDNAFKNSRIPNLNIGKNKRSSQFEVQSASAQDRARAKLSKKTNSDKMSVKSYQQKKAYGMNLLHRIEDESFSNFSFNSQSSAGASHRSKSIKKTKNKLPTRRPKAPLKKSQFCRFAAQEPDEEESSSEAAPRKPQVPSQEESDYTSSGSEKGNRYGERRVGPLFESERRRRVLRYLRKKHNKAFMKKFVYGCRKQVAEKRLRIKGRFVTKPQAFEILGLT